MTDYNALRAAWMRSMCKEWLADYPRSAPSALEAEHYDEQIAHSIECIDAIPAPTHEQLLAEALALPEIKRLWEALVQVGGRLDNDFAEDRESLALIDAAFAALPKGGSHE